MSELYLNNLDRSTFELVLAPARYESGKLVHDKLSVVPKNDDVSHDCIEAFVNVLDRANSLECIADEANQPGGLNVVLTHIDTNKKATLNIKYDHEVYSARIVLGSGRQVSFKNGVLKAAEAIGDYLSGKKRETRRRFAEEVPDDKYAHLESMFSDS